jgi:hypothetical protein
VSARQAGSSFWCTLCMQYYGLIGGDAAGYWEEETCIVEDLNECTKSIKKGARYPVHNPQHIKKWEARKRVVIIHSNFAVGPSAM